MTFVDTNIWMYAVGRPHPLRDEARGLLQRWVAERQPLATSAEVLQELLHAYLPVQRLDTLDAALRLATDLAQVWPLEEGDVALAVELARDHPQLSARDLTHVAVCVRRDAPSIATFDRGLAAAFRRIAG